MQKIHIEEIIGDNIVNLYTAGSSLNSLESKFGYSRTVIRNFLVSRNIVIRGRKKPRLNCKFCGTLVVKIGSSSCKNCVSQRNKELRREKYWSPNKGKQMSQEQKDKISRTRIERGVAKKEKNPAWKAYKISGDLKRGIRLLSEYVEWRGNVFKRDSFTCQECGHVGKPIEVHHIIPFIALLDRFVEIYSQFSPIEDKETLVRLAIKHAPFWDITNGITLCRSCHNKTRGINQYTKALNGS